MTLVRYKENPFIDDMVVPVKSKTVRLSRLGKDSNILVNQATGEVQGTHITTYKKVDAEQFVKLFSANIAMTFDLKSAGLKALNVLIWAVQHRAIGKDQIELDAYALEEFLTAHKEKKPPLSLSLATYSRGINELERSQIIAKTMRKGRYFLNPNFVFNGDRIAFTTVIERKKEEEQLDIFDEVKL